MAVSINVYPEGKLQILNSTVDLDSHTIKVILGSSTLTFASTDTLYADVSGDQTANGSGYTTGGATLANKVVNRSSNTVKFDADDVVWTASGGTIAAYNAVIYSSTSNYLLAHVSFGERKAADDGATFTIAWGANGIIRST